MTLNNRKFTFHRNLSAKEALWLHRGVNIGESALNIRKYSAYTSAGAFVLIGTALILLAVVGTFETSITQTPIADSSLR